MARVLATAMCALALAPPCRGQTAQRPPPLRFGVFPHQSLLRMEELYAPLAAFLASRLERPVRFGTSSSYERFRRRLRSRDFDAALVSPLDHVEVARAAGYRVALRQVGSLQALLVAKPQSGIRKAADLRGATIAMPPRESAAARLGLEVIVGAGLTPGRDVTLLFLPHESACVEHLRAGRLPAIVATRETLRLGELREGAHYVEIARSREVHPPVLVVRDSLPSTERDAIVRALLDWSADRGSAANPAAVLGFEPADRQLEEAMRREWSAQVQVPEAALSIEGSAPTTTPEHRQTARPRRGGGE